MSRIDMRIYSEMMGDVSHNLRKEIKELTYKLQKAREDANWGTYKNLILAYKEIIQLYRNVILDVYGKEIKEKAQNINGKLTIEFDESVEKFLEYLKTPKGFLVELNIETIPLVDEQNYKYQSSLVENGKLITKFNMTDILQNKLKQGAKEHKLIDVTGFRGIGKTYQLINFAKENEYMVIVDRYAVVKNLRKEYNYDNIYRQNDYELRGIRNTNCVVDEGVNVNEIKNKLDLNIITGYVNKNLNKNKIIK